MGARWFRGPTRFNQPLFLLDTCYWGQQRKPHTFILTAGPHKLTYSGIGCYHPRFFRKYMPRKNHYPLAPLLKQSAKDNNLGGQYFDGYWNDVGTPERLQEINNQHNRK